ncbi:unnamed protein product [Nesidiocoris tenuis]|uniref:Uncharacterized protein n=1 Tax=Nesidiocoris tenuis TaxID=355587 RepID=A0A6H5H0D7_9HEMI|nr:unnamed protein product [Nesidiocoris tenuis]
MTQLYQNAVNVLKARRRCLKQGTRPIFKGKFFPQDAMSDETNPFFGTEMRIWLRNPLWAKIPNIQASLGQLDLIRIRLPSPPRGKPHDSTAGFDWRETTDRKTRNFSREDGSGIMTSSELPRNRHKHSCTSKAVKWYLFGGCTDRILTRSESKQVGRCWPEFRQGVQRGCHLNMEEKFSIGYLLNHRLPYYTGIKQHSFEMISVFCRPSEGKLPVNRVIFGSVRCTVGSYDQY